MASPNRVQVGNLSTITFAGPGRYVRPFQDVGDTQSFEWHIDCYQLAANFSPFSNVRNFNPGFVQTVELMQSIYTTLGVAYLVHEDQPEYTNVQGWLKFRRVYASLPITRTEPTSLVFPFQFISTSADYTWENPPAAPEVSEWPLTISGYRVYEYFAGQIPTIKYAPKVTAIYNTLLYVGTWPIDYSKPWIAQDSAIRVYKGSIYERMTLYANGIKPSATP
jgi:hypothetical protein